MRDGSGNGGGPTKSVNIEGQGGEDMGRPAVTVRVPA